MSDDKVISMKDFKKTEMELNGTRPSEENYVGYTKVMIVKDDEHILAIVEQGVEDDDGNDVGVSGITLDYNELLVVMGQLEECKNKMADILREGED